MHIMYINYVVIPSLGCKYLICVICNGNPRVSFAKLSFAQFLILFLIIQLILGPSYTLPDCYRSIVVFISSLPYRR